jgi:hypothetical protein
VARALTKRECTEEARAHGAAAAELAQLDRAIESVRLYAPGRLLHLQRVAGTTPDSVSGDARESSDESASSADGAAGEEPMECAARHESSPTRAPGHASIFPSPPLRWRSKKKKLQERFILVEADPPDAHFEFIAVRSTWIKDHLLGPMLAALQSSEAPSNRNASAAGVPSTAAVAVPA